MDADRRFLERVLDLSPGIVFVADRDLNVTFTNQAATDLLGYARDELVGRSVFDFLDADWNPDAFASIATALGSGGGPRPPMTFRVITRDGRRPIVEATANIQLDDPLIGGLVVYARPWTERWLLDQAFESVAAGDPIDRTMDLLVEVAGADTMSGDASIVFDAVDGAFQRVLACRALPDELRGPAAGLDAARADAWTSLFDAQQGFVVNVSELPDALRADAEAHGYRSLWAAPADRDRRGLPAVWAIAWRREPHLDADETRTGMMARLATLAGLALARSRNEEHNAHAASHDAMTGLWNRNAVFEWLGRALTGEGEGESEGGVGVGVIYLDLDRFKPINDVYGHAAGDRVLREVAQRLTTTCPTDRGRVGRFGGDEFVYVGPASELGEVEQLAARLAVAVTAPIELRSGEVVHVGASAGSSFTMPGRLTADELVEQADAALNRVKERRSTR
jgi:diguanylate cyclase (GGDEF)-like protein/PAS domain S-box-containing protein